MSPPLKAARLRGVVLSASLRVNVSPLVDEALKESRILIRNIAGPDQRRELKLSLGVDVSALVDEEIRDRHLLGEACSDERRVANVVFRL